MTESVRNETEKKNGKMNRNLLAGAIASVILVVVACLYLDRQGRLELARARSEATADLLDEWGPRGANQARAAVGARAVAFTPVSYKNIIARVAPSVVSVNVEAGGFIDQGNKVQPVVFPRGSGLNPWCPPGGPMQQAANAPQPQDNQALDQSGNPLGSAKYVWGGRMGGWGAGPIGNLICPNCNTSIPHQRGVPAYTVSCPNCGTQMMRQGTPGTWGGPSQAQQMGDPSPQGWGSYLCCPNCYTTMPCRRVPGGFVGCPSCGMCMQQVRTTEQWSGGSAPPVGTLAAQQGTAPQNGYQFQGPTRGGSGVIVNRVGYVLTNHHVVHGAKSISVTLSSGKITKTYPARLIDEAAEFDFAILKILTTGDEQFSPAPIGNSAEVSVGDEVLAMGSPFGLSQTVTFGIVSNTARTLTVGDTKFTNFFQTDAPINPGSSGGPLVNVRGEVIGINTAIYSPTQAFSGIGFASPIDPAKAAFTEFIELSPNTVTGALARKAPSWLRGGLTPAARLSPPRLRGQGLLPFCPRANWVGQAVNARGASPWVGLRAAVLDSQAKDLLDLPAGMSKGVVVTEVFDNSPALWGGVQHHDVILRVDDRSVKDVQMFQEFLSNKKPGDGVNLTVYRDGKRVNLEVNLAAGTPGMGIEGVIQGQAVALATGPQQPFDPANAAPPGLKGVLAGGEVGAGEIEALGMGVEDLVPELGLAFNIPKGVKGVIITEVANQAQAAGLLAGDVIRGINNRRVKSIVDFIKVMNTANMQQGITLDIYRQGQRFQVTMKG